MKAALCRAYGPPGSLRIEELPDPEPGPGQVVVHVRAAAVNFPDVLILADRYQMTAPLPFAPGSEFAGVVGALGPGVSEVREGDRVFGACFVGAFAEKIAAPAAALMRIPDGVDFETAAAFWVCHSTAWAALVPVGKLREGETLAVLGAAGGVGLAAVEIGRELGARVIAVASSPEKLAACREAGADEGIDYAKEDLKLRLRELTGGGGADVVIDPVGGSATEAALRATAFRGRLVVVGFASGEIPKVPANLLLLRGAQLLGFAIGPFLAKAPDEALAMRAALLERLAAGRLRPRIASTWPLERAADALEEVAARRAIGKVVVRISP